MIRRGLTLVEVLAATVLLVIITTTCLPLFRDAIRTARADPADAPFGLADVAEVADRLIADPVAFDLPSLDEIDSVEVPWPDAPERSPLIVRRLGGSSPATDERSLDDDMAHAWIQIRCGSWCVHRWMHVTQEDETATPEGEASAEASMPESEDAP